MRPSTICPSERMLELSVNSMKVVLSVFTPVRFRSPASSMDASERSRRSFAGREEVPPNRKTEESWKGLLRVSVELSSSRAEREGSNWTLPEKSSIPPLDANRPDCTLTLPLTVRSASPVSNPFSSGALRVKWSRVRSVVSELRRR